MKTIEINGRNYTFEFTFEAAMHEECVEKIISLIDGITSAQANENVQGYIASIAKAPKTVINMVYAGLLEHHADEIKNVKDASNLIKDYFAEHKEDGEGNFMSLMSLMMETMENDGFFNMIGLDEIFNPGQKETAQKAPKTPQDHKKKATKTSEK